MNKIYDLIEKQKKIFNSTINLIASENINLAPVDSLFLDYKYAEGLPYKRYYNGCEIFDEIEQAAILKANQLFKSNFSNVQPYSGSQSVQAALLACLQKNDTLLSLELSQGGHLTHGFNNSLASRLFNCIFYSLNSNWQLDYDKIDFLYKKHKPKLIILGFSSFLYDIDYKLVRELCPEAIILADISHTSGLVISNLLNHPFNYADIIVTSTHKMLRGPRGGLIMWNNSNIKINKGVFPSLQGGPHFSSILGKLKCLENASYPEFINYNQQVLKNAVSLYNSLYNFFGSKVHYGCNHIILLEMPNNITAQSLANRLENFGIIVNVNKLPNNSEGIRLGTPFMTTKGLTEKSFEMIGELIISIFLNNSIDPEKFNFLINQCFDYDYFY